MFVARSVRIIADLGLAVITMGRNEWGTSEYRLSIGKGHVTHQSISFKDHPRPLSSCLGALLMKPWLTPSPSRFLFVLG